MYQDNNQEIMVSVQPEHDNTPADPFAARNTQPSQPPKKSSKAGKVILGVLIAVVALVLVAVIAVGVIGVSVINKATAEVPLPVDQKVESGDMTLFIAEACVGLLANEEFSIGNDDMQMFVDQIQPTIESSLKGMPVELKDLFVVFAQDKGTIYAQLYLTEVEVKGFNIAINKDIYVSAPIDISFESPNIVAQIKEINCGNLAIPVSYITPFLSSIQLPEGLSISGDEIYYDVSGLDAMIDEMLPTVMAEQLGDNALSAALSGLLVENTDVEITGADILDDELVISAHIF